MRAGRHFVMLVSMHMMQYNLSLSNIAQRIVKYLFFFVFMFNISLVLVVSAILFRCVQFPPNPKQRKKLITILVYTT